MRVEIRTLLDADRPTIEMAELDEAELSALRADVARKYPTAVVRVLAGQRMRDLRGLVQEIAAALQLPTYVSPTWSSLTDGLRELRYSGATAYLLIIVDAAMLLADTQPDELITFLDVVTEENRDWQEAPGSPRLRLLLVQPPYALPELEQRLSMLKLVL